MAYIHGTSPEEQHRLSKLNEIINQACLEQIEPGYESRILDVGSGLGQFTRMLTRSCRGSAVGVERDPDQFAAAKALLQEGDNVEFREGDGYSLPLSPDERGSFDIAHARFVLEHVSEPLRVVYQMVQAVKPRGRIFLMDDDHDLLRLDPSPEPFLVLWKAYTESYTSLGSDPYIGRKLPQLLHKAGALPVRASAIYFGACNGQDQFNALCTNMAGLIESARETMLGSRLCTEDELEAGLAAFGEWKLCPYSNLVFIAPFAEGVRL